MSVNNAKSMKKTPCWSVQTIRRLSTCKYSPTLECTLCKNSADHPATQYIYVQAYT